jgi:hypothetical protein
VSFKISNLYPPLREFMRMPEGTQVLYEVDDFAVGYRIMHYVYRAQGEVSIKTLLALPTQGGLSENLVMCTVVKSAPPAKKTGPKLN